MKTKLVRIHKHILSSQWIIGLLLAAGAALGFSAKAIFVKLAYTYGVDAITLLMFRMMFALPFFVLIAIIEERKSSRRISTKDMAFITILGLIGYYLSSLLDFLGLQYISAGLERLILFAYPTLVVFLSALFLGKKIQQEAVVALLLSYIGIALAMMHDVQLSSEHVLLGSALVFASTLTYSTFLVGSGEIIPEVGARRFTAYAMVVSCLAVFAQFAVMRSLSDFNQPVAVYGFGMAMAVVSTVIPAFLLAGAIARIGASQTSIVGSLGPIATIGMAVIFLNESISIMQMSGAILVIGSIFMLSKKRRENMVERDIGK